MTQSPRVTQTESPHKSNTYHNTHCWGWRLQGPVSFVTNFKAFKLVFLATCSRQPILKHKLSFLLSLLILGSSLILGEHSLFSPVLTLLSVSPTLTQTTQRLLHGLCTGRLTSTQSSTRIPAGPFSLHGARAAPSVLLSIKQGKPPPLPTRMQNPYSVIMEQTIQKANALFPLFKPPARSQQGRILQ